MPCVKIKPIPPGAIHPQIEPAVHPPRLREWSPCRAQIGKKLPARTQQNQLVAGQFPYKMKQGIYSRQTGNLLSRAGNLQRLAKNCPASFFAGVLL
jgi:hypothetical protein